MNKPGKQYLSWYVFIIIANSCGSGYEDNQHKIFTGQEYTNVITDGGDQVPPPIYLNTGFTTPAEVVNYAQTLIGVPYKYGSVDPAVGFDCSGFITYVFNHFNIKVPRSSVHFTFIGNVIPVETSKSGDIILFTGTDSTDGIVGHMGIVISNNENLLFIHSTSGKAKGVTITPMSDYYRSRFVKVIRVFRQNDEGETAKGEK